MHTDFSTIYMLAINNLYANTFLETFGITCLIKTQTNSADGSVTVYYFVTLSITIYILLH